jgi:hypothetical protein
LYRSRDAQMLARIGRLDPALLYPVRHGTEEAQADLLRIKLRDNLVRARVALINSVRFSLKSLGYAVRNPSSERFHKVVEEGLPETLRQMIAPSVQALAELTARIKVLEREINSLAQRKYPQTARLQQIPGVGPITALYFVLKIEDPNRFENVRDVGAYAGLCPGRDQSGESDPQLRTSKCGDAYLRRLLVSASQVYPRSVRPRECPAPIWVEAGGRGHSASEETCDGGSGAKAGGPAPELVEEPAHLSTLSVRPSGLILQERKKRTDDSERLRCIAGSAKTDFGNQMERSTFCGEPGSKHGPTY